METNEIIKQIIKLPVDERLLVIERTLKSIRGNAIKEKMIMAVEELQEEYRTNKELTVFTEIDFENFYESR